MGRGMVGAGVCAGAWLLLAQSAPVNQAQLWQHRNLGKAFYENPTTQKQAVGEFRKALALVPDSAGERLNFGLALLRAGETAAGIEELTKVQKQDPKLPHTWFNLAIAYKKQGDFDKALAQIQGMLRLVPSEPIAHYQLGTLYKLKGDNSAAIREFETARDLNPRLAAAHFQLYGLYRQTNRAEDAARELRSFQERKKEQEAGSITEDVDWCNYAEIYDPVISEREGAPLGKPSYHDEKVADGFAGDNAGVLALVLDGGTRPSLIAWSAERVVVLQNGKTPVTDSGLQSLRGVVSIAAGDFDNDGRADLCVITAGGAALYRNVNGRFRKHVDVATGSFRKAVWIDFDHDYDEDLILFGNDSRLMRNNGAAGFSDETKRFPFVSGRALDVARIDTDRDATGFDLATSYAGRAPVLYHDKLGGVFEAGPLAQFPEPDGRTVLADFDGNGRQSRARIAADGSLHLDHNVTPDYGNWTEIALLGVKNAKLAHNARIEVKAGASYQRFIYDGVPAVFRLGKHAGIDTVRITWPNGLIQNELAQPINRVLSVKEAPRLSGSCPMIFTWNG